MEKSTGEHVMSSKEPSSARYDEHGELDRLRAENDRLKRRNAAALGLIADLDYWLLNKPRLVVSTETATFPWDERNDFLNRTRAFIKGHSDVIPGSNIKALRAANARLIPLAEIGWRVLFAFGWLAAERGQR